MQRRGLYTGTRNLLAGAMLAAMLLLAGPARAQETTVKFDPAKTTISWTLGDVLHTVHGTFQLTSGTITFNETTGAASGELVVSAASGDSGNGMRDRKMKKEILQVVKFPDVVFLPKKVIGHVAPEGNSVVNVEGIFRIHGIDHPLTLNVPVTVHGSQITMTTGFGVPYVAWGMKDPSTFVLRVEKVVQVSIQGAGEIER